MGTYLPEYSTTVIFYLVGSTEVGVSVRVHDLRDGVDEHADLLAKARARVRELLNDPEPEHAGHLLARDHHVEGVVAGHIGADDLGSGHPKADLQHAGSVKPSYSSGIDERKK